MSKFKDVKEVSKLKEKYLSKGDIQAIADYKKAIDENDIIVTCMGLYNHGKSTLLNALIGDYENKTFKAADVRETSVNKTIQHGNINFVDTPGLNAHKNDDKRVMDAIKQSDINLFVHTVTTGEFAENEMKFLNNVKKHWKNPQEFIDRTIFVVSRIDKANDTKVITNAVKKMSQQIMDIFNTNATIIPVSAVRYTKGKLENKKLMVKKSNVDTLKEIIKNLSHKLTESIRETREKRLENTYNMLIKQLSTEIQMNKLEISKQKQVEKKYLVALNNDIKTIQSTLKNMYTQLGEL